MTATTEFKTIIEKPYEIKDKEYLVPVNEAFYLIVHKDKVSFIKNLPEDASVSVYLLFIKSSDNRNFSVGCSHMYGESGKMNRKLKDQLIEFFWLKFSDVCSIEFH